MTRDPRLYFPSEGSHTQDFYALKKSIDPSGDRTREPRIQRRVWYPLDTYVTAHSPTLTSLYLRHSSFPNPSVALLTSSSFSNPSVASPTSQLIIQTFSHFIYVTIILQPFRTLPTSQLILQPFHCFILCSFSNPSVTSPTSHPILQPFRRFTYVKLIFQPFRCFTYVTAHSPNL